MGGLKIATTQGRPRGLVDYGPLQPMPGDKVRIGVIGTDETSDRFAQFIERCSTGVDGKSQKIAAGWCN